MSSHVAPRAVGRVLLTISLICASVLGGAVLQSSAAATFAAKASVTPGIQYVGDTTGSTFTFTIKNTGTTDSIGAVEIGRPTSYWTITACPAAPAGWTAQTADTKCRYRSAATKSDDIAHGASSSAFKVTAKTKPGTRNVLGTWPVKVSKSSTFSSTTKLIAAPSTPPGLGIVAHSFEIMDVVVDPTTTTPGAACPTASKSADAGTGDHTFVVCGRNRTTIPLTPDAVQASLDGTFVASHGRFASGEIAPTNDSRILGSWKYVTVTSSVGIDKTVLARVGSASNRTSPVTELEEYEATAPSNDAPVAANDTKTVAEDSSGTTVDVLANDTDADGDTLAVSAINTTGTDGQVTNNGTDVTYDPQGAFDSLNAGETDTDTFSYTVSDGHGGTDTAIVTVTITGAGTSPNSAPVAVDDLKTVSEDASGTTVNVLSNDTDADADTLAVSAINTTGTDGQVTNNGTDVTYDPQGAFESLNAGETDTDTFSYTVSDGHGGTDTAIVTVTITGANDAPVVTGLEPGALAYTENGAAAPLTATGTVADVDSANFSTGALTVDFSVAGQAEDRLAVRNVGTGVGQISVSGANVSYGSTLIGTVDGGTGTTPLVITLNSSATPAAVQALLRNITYANVSENPSTATRTARFVLTDGDGGTSSPATRQVTVARANDAPVAGDDVKTVAEDAGGTTVNVLSNDTDADGDTLAVSVVTTTGTQGLVTNNGTNVTYNPSGAFGSLNAGDTATDTFSYTVSDGHGGTDTATVTITITGVGTVNTAPAAVDDVKTVGEDSGATTIDVLANDTDADSDTLAVSAISTTGTQGSVTNNGTNVSYSPNGAFNALQSGDTATDTFSYTVSDGHGGTDTATVTVTITGVNDAPVIAGFEAGGLAYTENGAATPITASGTVTDVDSANFSTGTLTVDFSAGGQAEDRLAVRNVGNSAGQIGVSGANVSYAGTPIGTFTGGTGTTPLVVTLNAAATPGAVQALVRDITYANVSDDPSTFARTARFVLTDGDGGTSSPATRQITVTAANDAPVITSLEAGALAYTENAAATPITATGSVTDADSANFSTGTLTVDFSAAGQAEDRLAVRNVGTGAGQIGVAGANISYGGTVIGTVTGGTGTTALVVTLNASATPAATQALARNITYANVSQNPSTTTRTARFVLTDGDGGTSSPATRQITVARVNDAPVAGDDVKTVAEDAAPTTVTVLANDTDVDGDTLAVSAIDTTGTAGLVTNNGTNVTYDPNGAFDALNAGQTGTDTFSYTVSDGQGGTDTATVTITINGVDAANVPPVAVDDVKTVTEDAGATTVDVLANDTDADGDTVAVSAVSTTGTTGSVTNNGTNVSYNPNGAFNALQTGDTATDTFTYTVSDGHGGTDTATVTVTITAVNDAPVVTVPDSSPFAYTENQTATQIAALGTVTDVDSANFSTGTLTADFSAGGQAEDRLAVRNVGTGAGQISVAGANVSYGGTLIGTATGGTGTTPLVITLNASATPAAVQALLRNITYANVSENPSTTARTARFVVTDGDGGTSAPATRQITVAGVNDAPLVLGLESGTRLYTENAAAVQITATAAVTDSDSANFDTGALTVDFSAGGQAEDRLTIRNLGTGAGQIGVSGSNITFEGTVIGTVSGGTGTTPLVITLNASSTPFAVQNLIGSTMYANVSENPSTATRTARFVLTDGDGGASVPATRDISVTATNDAPVVTGLEAGALAYTENGLPTPITATGTVTDVDSTDLSTGTLTVDLSAGAESTDLLLVRNVGTAAGQISVSGSNVSYGGTLIGTFSGGIGPFPLVVTLNASATPAAAQELVRNITYVSTSDNPSTATRTARFVLTDGDGGTSAPATRQIAVTAVNDAPVVSLDAALPLSYTEQAGFVNAFGPNATVVDIDTTTMTSLTVSVTGFDNAFDTLELNPLVTGYTSSFSAGTLTITRTGGATPAQFQNVLRNIRFSNTSDDPDHRNDGTANSTDAIRNFAVVVNDGTLASPSANRGATIVPVNDAPTAPSTLPVAAGVRNTTLVSGNLGGDVPSSTRVVNFIGNSTDPDGLESAIAVVPVTSVATAQSGRFTLSSLGSRYEPPASATITSDTYTYSLTDGTSTRPVTYTINFSGAVWYVEDDAPALQDGTSSRPFGTVAAALAAAGPGQPVHIRKDNGDGILSGSVVLTAGDKLLGEGVALNNTDVGSTTAELLYPAGAKPVLTAPAGQDVVTLAATTQIAGLSINADGAANGLTGTAASGVVLRSMDVTDTGAAATQPAIELTGTGNGMTFTAPVSVSSTQAGALNLNGAALSGTLASTIVSGSTTSPGVNLVNTTGSLTFTTTVITTTGQPGFVLNNAANIDVTSGGVATTNRAAVDATGLAAGSDLAFTDVDSTNSTGDGINLDGADAGWTFSAGAGSTISGATGIGFDVNNGTGAVSYAGSIASSGGRTVDVSSRTGNTTFSGSFTGTGTGILVTGNSGGTTTFSGVAKTLSTGVNPAVSLTSNTGHTTAFTNGGLAVTTTSGAGFSATTGGTVTVAGTGNTVTTGTGVGVNLDAVGLGTSNVTFQKVSSNGASSGIVLTNTTGTGTFNVTGTGAVDTGGIINGTTGPGVSLLNADRVSLNNVRIQGADRSGVQGVGVTGFSFTNGAITNAGDTHVNDNDSSIAFNATTGGQNNNVDGDITITGNTLSGAYGGGVDIFNYAGTITNATISNNTVSSSTDVAQSRRSGISLNLFGSGTTVASLTKATISGNTVSGFPSGDAINIQGANTASSTAPAGTYGTPGTANVVSITGNQVVGDATNKINGFGISASVTGRGQGNFSITNNGTAASPMRNMKGSAIGIGAAGTVTTYFVVTGNQITANNGFSSSGIALGTDKNIQADLSILAVPTVRATISNNTIANTSGGGMRVLQTDSNGKMDLKVQNNTNTSAGAGATGILIENGSSGNATYNSTMCADISGNSPTGGGPDGFGDQSPGIILDKATSVAATYVFGLVGLAPVPAPKAQVETFATGLNPTSSLGAGFYAGKRVYVRGDNFGSCTLPAGM